MTPESLHQAFLNTRYIVHLEPDVTLRNYDKSTDLLTRLPHLTSWAFITAWNPLPEILTMAKNFARNGLLRARLEEGKYIVHEGTGISADGIWAEAFFLIENITLAEAHTIAKDFGQLAFVYGGREKGNELVYIE